MYQAKIKEVASVDTYRRNTHLDDPDTDQQDFKFSDLLNLDTKLSKEEQIDDHEIKSQFVAGADADNHA